jgi:hypothetical protein
MVRRNKLALAALELVSLNAGIYKPSLCRKAGKVPARKRTRVLKMVDTIAFLRRTADRCRIWAGPAGLATKKNLLDRLDGDLNAARVWLRSGFIDAADADLTWALNLHTHPSPFDGLVMPSPLQVPIEVYQRYTQLLDGRPTRFLTLCDEDVAIRKKRLHRLAARLWRRYATTEFREGVARDRAEVQALANTPHLSANEQEDMRQLFRAGLRALFGR